MCKVVSGAIAAGMSRISAAPVATTMTKNGRNQPAECFVSNLR